MPYSLGIDVGTTFTAAATSRNDRVEVVALEAHHVTVPTVIAAEGDEMRFGATAVARLAGSPESVAREFKRRLGDPVPVLMSGAPYSADRLVALFAEWVVGVVSAQYGEPPTRTVVTHPANWTEFQRHLLTNALDQVGLGDAGLLTEPQAAAIDFAANVRVDPGGLVLVYDLGGGTFDIALLRQEEIGLTHVGEAAGVERLGGIDFDEAVFQHVLGWVPSEVLQQVRGDPNGSVALGQLRARCVEAKEALSGDVSVDVPVLLPGFSSTVRITRAEFEGMIRPMLRQTIELARQVLERSGVGVDDLAAVLLVGGSSRIPLVAELVASELQTAVRVDAHPKLVVARGAARSSAALAVRPRRGPGVARAALAIEPDDEPRSRWPLVLGVVAAVLLVAGAGWWLLGRDDDTTESDGGPQTTAVADATAVTDSGDTSPTTLATSSASTAPSATATPAPAAFPAAVAPVPPNVIIFTRLRSDGVRQLWSVDAARPADDPARVQRVNTGGGSIWDNLPALSPDRQLIAYTTARASVYTLGVTAWEGGVRELQLDGQPLTVANDARTTWAPDGVRLAYVANRDGREDLYVFDAATGAETRLTNDDFSEADPAWSPSSDEILYTAAFPATGRDLMRIDAAGGAPTAVTSEPGDETDPAWSPDGSQIAFARRAPVENAPNELFVMARDGTGARRLIDPAFDTGSPARGDSDPTWSPDGAQIAFESERDAGIWIVAVDGLSDPQPLTRLDGWISVHPAWS